ncbi:hypothetical protein COCOBI_13-0330 [Coccomyxa sp. Obi]|nr:hypothetical protein COCOBI_13-0330 [Coccomyxa sp. Obi]
MGGLRASILAWVVLSLASQSLAAVRISAYFNNKLLPGDQGSTDGSYELLSLSFSLAQSVSNTPSGIQADMPTQGAVNVLKRGDEWDPNFETLELYGSSNGLDTVVLSMQTLSGSGNLVPIFNITLNNVFITSNQFSLQSGSQETYAFSLNYEAIVATYYEYDASGAQITESQTPSYNFALQ